MLILGVSAYYHDSAACLIRDGEIVAAAQEERFTRKKHDSGFPGHAVRYCLRQGGIGLQDLTYIVFYDKPLLKYERLLETYLSFAPRGIVSFIAAMPVWIKEKMFLKDVLRKELMALAGDVEKTPYRPSFLLSIMNPTRPLPSILLRLTGPRFYAWMGSGNGPPLRPGVERAIR